MPRYESLLFSDFIERSKNTHADKYDYSLVVYNKCFERVKIICKRHGMFEQTPRKHWGGRGCPICGIEKNTKRKRFDKKDICNKK